MKPGRIIFRSMIILSAILLVVSILFYNGIFEFVHKTPAPEIISDMDYSCIDIQSSYNFFSDSSISRVPPENTYPMYSDYYDLDQTEIQEGEIRNNINPIPITPEIKNYAKHLYQTYCIACHGESGKGDGPIVTQVVLPDGEEGLPAPPDFKSDNTMGYSDARLFHVLSGGQNLMFPVAHKITPNQRWALVHYIRLLQKN